MTSKFDILFKNYLNFHVCCN